MAVATHEKDTEWRHFQIYVIYDLDDDAYYIGSAWARPASVRFMDHMRQDSHSGARLVQERVALGHHFSQEILQEGDGPMSAALVCEEWWMQCALAVHPERPTLNINHHPSRGPRGVISQSEREKRSALLKGKPRPGGTPWMIGKSPPSKGKKMPSISAAKMGHEVSEETRKKLSVAMTGRAVDFTEAHRQHLKDAYAARTEEEKAAWIERLTASINAQQKWACDECGLVTNRGPLTTHQTHRAHVGATPC